MERDKQVNIRFSNEEKVKIEDKSKEYGFETISEYLRFVGLNAVVEVQVK
jgi:hypothetical protein